MDGRPFVNAANAGLAVDAARSAAALKKALGPMAYAVGAVRAGVSTGRRGCRVTCDGSELFDGEAWQVIVAGTGHFGGGSQVDAAEDDDGELDVAVVPAGSRLRLVQRAYGLRTGRLTGQRGVHHARGCRIVVEGARRSTWTASSSTPRRGRSSASSRAPSELVVPG